MSHLPQRIHTSQADLDAIEGRIRQLHDEAIVRVTLANGDRFEGVVAVRPIVETFRDVDGKEGHNALLRLDDRTGDQSPHYLWVGEIVAIEPLGSA